MTKRLAWGLGMLGIVALAVAIVVPGLFAT